MAEDYHVLVKVELLMLVVVALLDDLVHRPMDLISTFYPTEHSKSIATPTKEFSLV